MDAIEKRARELLDLHAEPSVAAVEGGGTWFVVREQDALAAITAALTPPEGYVLVQETQLRHLLRDAITSVEFIAGRGQSKPLSRRVSEQACALVESVPARRKVP
ncbi:hypothetical protein [Stenotrophomonas sp. SMYL8]|uniref:hypothetical protein n=1 Tax=Stenotrophomonas sp. SMYL8 TaxID=3076041 RepID=UPI002E789536|nr:hypothetical protein [Stenotrophomonas sp. SMYL8]